MNLPWSFAFAVAIATPGQPLSPAVPGTEDLPLDEAPDPSSAPVIDVVERDVPRGATARAGQAKGCVVLGVSAHPNRGVRRAFFSRLCLRDDTLIEERGVFDGRAGRERIRRLDVDSALMTNLAWEAPPSPGRAFADPVKRRRFRAAEAIGAPMTKGNRAAVLAVLGKDVVARALVLDTLSGFSLSAGDVELVIPPGQEAFFAQQVPSPPWSEPSYGPAPVAWSTSGALFSVSRWPYGDFVPPRGYADFVGTVVAFDTLQPVVPDDGSFHVVAFDGERPIISVIGGRACAPTTFDGLMTGNGCPPEPPDAPPEFVESGDFERWEAVVDIAGPVPVLVRSIGPFFQDEMCAEVGPAGVYARRRVVGAGCGPSTAGR